MLTTTEAYGEKIKMNKYYFCVTLCVYETLWLLSTINLINILTKTASMEEYIEELTDMKPFESYFFVSYSKLFYVVTCGIALFLHWIKNTYVHVSLCHSKIFEVRRNCKTIFCHCIEWFSFLHNFQYELKGNPYDSNRFAWFLEFFLPIVFVILSSILIVHNNMAFNPMKHGFFLPIYYVACMAGS